MSEKSEIDLAVGRSLNRLRRERGLTLSGLSEAAETVRVCDARQIARTRLVSLLTTAGNACSHKSKGKQQGVRIQWR